MAMPIRPADREDHGVPYSIEALRAALSEAYFQVLVMEKSPEA